MMGKRNIGSVAVIGGLSAAIALLTGLPAVSADELADLRANQELLQKRIDQLSQAPPPAAPGPYVPGFGPETRAVTKPVTTGSFPRSFLIPGTETSLRIGGIAWTTVLWYMHGARRTTALNGQGGNPDDSPNGMGGTGGLPNIPLNGEVGHSRAQSFTINSRPSRLLFDARTPTAWGEVKAYIEMDFAAANGNTINNGVGNVTSGWIPRLRKAYGTIGGFLVGQETGIFHDPDADAEFADFGGGAATSGRARVPQVKYTYQGPYGTVWAIGIENPLPAFTSRNGTVNVNSTSVPGTSPCSVTGNTTAANPATTACVSSGAFFNINKRSWPELVGTARINQPWGHLSIGGVVRNNNMNDGQFIDQSYIGYGGRISGDVHPFSGASGPLGKDDLGGGTAHVVNSDGQIGNGVSVATNFGSNINVPGFGFVNPLSGEFSADWNRPGSDVRRAYDRAVRFSDSVSHSGWIWYQHWWTNNLRSTLENSFIWNTLDTALIGQNTNNNKFLYIAHANLFWSPVGFVDLGLEYSYGHRQTISNRKGDAYAINGLMRVRF